MNPARRDPEGSAQGKHATFMSFGDHLDELRRRFIWSIAGVLVLLVFGIVFGDRLMAVIADPAVQALRAAGQGGGFQATSPLEGFGSFVKIATVTAIVLGMPWILYQFWLFISPGLYPHEQRFVYLLMPLSGLLTVIGLAALYFLILPLSLYFLITFGSGLLSSTVTTSPLPEGITLPVTPVLPADPEGAAAGSMWVNSTLGQLRIQVDAKTVMGMHLVSGGLIAQQYRISEYVNLVFLLGVSFAVAFQLPLVLMLLSWTGMVRAADVKRYRKQIIFGCCVGAALLPTQDPWSLLALSSMLVLLFEFGIVLMRFVPARRVMGEVDPVTDGEAEA